MSSELKHRNGVMKGGIWKAFEYMSPLLPVPKP